MLEEVSRPGDHRRCRLVTREPHDDPLTLATDGPGDRRRTSGYETRSSGTKIKRRTSKLRVDRKRKMPAQYCNTETYETRFVQVVAGAEPHVP